MPSTAQGGSSLRGYQSVGDVADRLGYDPARWLDVQLMKKGESHTDWSRHYMLLGRPAEDDDGRTGGMIAGLSLGEVNAWLQVERGLDRGPRQGIVKALEARREELLEHGGGYDTRGERGDALQMTASERRERAAELHEKRGETDATWTDREDGERSTTFRSGGKTWS